jgi:Putative viral replication protein/RNA helicase
MSDDDEDASSIDSTSTGGGRSVRQRVADEEIAPNVGGGENRVRRIERGRRARGWCWTLNNYTQGEVDLLRGLWLEGGSIEWLCFQPERAPETDTPHLQGAIWFTHPRELGGIKRLIGERAHLELMLGTCQQSRTYCSKPESRDLAAGFDFCEYGQLPAGGGAGRGSRTDVAEAVSLVRSGSTFAQVAEAYPGIALRYHSGLGKLFSAFQRPRNFKTNVRWYWGPTGSGKTRAAVEEAGDEVYFKMPANKWWDLYEGQENVIVDDYRRDFCTFGELLRLFDRYQLRVENKGGSVFFKAKCLWITTPKDPRSTWENRVEEDLQQLLRRIDVIKEFKSDAPPPLAQLFVPGFVPPVGF